jgi:hypothetical protein
MARSGSTSRRKGRDWQAELAKRWRDSGLWPDARSTQGQQGTQRGPRPPDVDGTPFWVEAKHSASTPLAALEQAEDEAQRHAEAYDALDLRPCIAVVRPRGKGPAGALVALRVWTLAELLDRVIVDQARDGLVVMDLPAFEWLCISLRGCRVFEMQAGMRGAEAIGMDAVPEAIRQEAAE